MDVAQFNHSPVEGHLGCFQFEVLINKAAFMYIHVQVFVGHSFCFFGINAQECNSGSYDSCMFNF